MELTPKARALIEPVRNALVNINAALESQPLFEPLTSERIFRIAMSDYCVHVYLPHLVRALAKRAPELHLMVENFLGPSFSHLESADIDFVITHRDRNLFGRDWRDLSLQSSDLFEDSFVCIVAEDHPVGDSMTVEHYLHYPHAVVHFGANVRTVAQAELERQGHVVKELLHVPSFSALTGMLPDRKSTRLNSRH